MKPGKTIVVAVREEATASIALERAFRMSRSSQDHFSLVHVSRMASWQRVSELLTPEWRIPEGQPRPDPYAWLVKLSESAKAAGHHVTHEVLEGEPGKAIVEHARQIGADLIVVAPPRDGLARELLLGSTALRILRTSTCPVLVARGRITSAYTRPLLAMDLDESGQRVAQAASAWLDGLQADLVHAYRVPEEGLLRMDGYPEDAITKLLGLVRADAESKMAAYQSALPGSTIHLEHGFASTVMLEVALRLKSDIVVLGKHRGSITDERTIGSVAQFMIYNCPTDILLVP
ncbi:MAG: universal stress protein [Ahniella sp.]|nr:universal stress protein [Ahniella sp.]